MRKSIKSIGLTQVFCQLCIGSELTSLKVIRYGDQLVWNAHSYLRLFPLPITPICSSIDEVLIEYQLWAQC